MISKLIGKAGFGLGLSNGSTILAYTITFVFAIVFAYNDRKNFPQQLYDLGCINPYSETVDICFQNVTMSEDCRSLVYSLHR